MPRVCLSPAVSARRSRSRALAVAAAAPVPPPPLPRAGVWRRLGRAATFWTRVAAIWAAYKATQTRVWLLRPVRGEDWACAQWRRRHDAAGEDMWALCSELRAFYAKVGQLVAMQAFVPESIRSKLSRLQDDMPPLAAAHARRIIEAELPAGRRLDDVFESIDLDSAIGCASIAQVHAGVLADARKTKVAVKVQMPDAAALMSSDLGNFRTLAHILQRTELKFDLVRPVDELETQLSAEFDFEREAGAMRRIHGILANVKGVRVPLPIEGLVSPRLLVMEYLDGVPLSRLEGRGTSKRAMRRVGRAIIRHLSSAYGKMILQAGYWQADPHPGNILLLNKKLDVGLIDFGQTKSIDDEQRIAFAQLVDAMARRHPPSVANGMKAMGIVVEEVGVSEGGKRKKRKRSRSKRPTEQAETLESSTTGITETKQESNVSRSPAFVTGATTVAPSEGKGRTLRSLTASGSKRVPWLVYNQLRTALVPPTHAREAATDPAVEGADAEPASLTRDDASTPGSHSVTKPTLTSAEKLAYTMFDTAEYAGVSSNPFSEESALRSATVTELPRELFFLLRTMQIMRGICHATGNGNFSMVKTWAPAAREVLQVSRARRRR